MTQVEDVLYPMLSLTTVEFVVAIVVALLLGGAIGWAIRDGSCLFDHGSDECEDTDMVDDCAEMM